MHFQGERLIFKTLDVVTKEHFDGPNVNFNNENNTERQFNTTFLHFETSVLPFSHE